MNQEYKDKIEELRKNHNEAEHYFLKKAAYEVKPKELKELIEDENIEIVDVRTKEEYSKGHLPKAISIPIEELENNVEEITNKLSHEKLHIVYCYCQFCNFARTAAIILAHHNYKVAVLKGGYKGWHKKLMYA